MRDKKSEMDIKSLKDFLELWTKFHSIYNDTISKDAITKEDETKFLETKGIIRTSYGALQNGLDFRYMPHGRITDPVSDILALDGILFMSEKYLRRLNEDWRDSYIFLNNILEALKSRKRHLEGFNPVGAFIKRLFESKGKE